ncbi:MAG: 50S ribosomal protein L19 [Candidatus Melainabacteria bacterium]|jgi:large subunit ribosomal protein L19|nr:50S ribosomal protein L19 [Candidatus Melainabacteria bacterium]
MNQIIQEIEAPLIKDNVPQMNIGDTVKVFVKIVEGNKERTQGYEGVIIKRRGSGVGETITVRRVFQGIGIERVFLVNSPRVEKITVQRRGHVRRAKLYYLRKRTGKATRIKEKVTGKKDHAATAAAPAQKAAPAKAEKAAPAPAESAPETTSES